MKKLKKVFTILIVMALAICQMQVAYAHSGRTDSQGGHRDNKNASGLGSYHYHCDGNPPHLHNNGVCPYSSSSATTSTPKSNASSSSTKTTTVSKYYKKATVKKVQKKLKNYGYKCGNVDGKYDKKVKRAIKQFQKDRGIRSNGYINKKLIKRLGIRI